MSSELTDRLWSWSVHTGDPLFAEAANEIEQLREECKSLASFLMSEYVWVHESIVLEVDKALEAYIGDNHDAPTESSSTS